MADPLLALKDVRAGYGDAVVLDDRLARGSGTRAASPCSAATASASRRCCSPSWATPASRAAPCSGAGRTSPASQPYRRARLGIGWVAQEREIFPSLSVEENLTVAARPDAGTSPASMTSSRASPSGGNQGQPALRRRAADAGDRPRADDQPGAAAARRAARGPRADHRRGTGPRDPPHDRRSREPPSF